MFLKIVFIIAVISFLLSVYSLRKENQKRELASVKKKLAKGRVIFQKKD